MLEQRLRDAGAEREALRTTVRVTAEALGDLRALSARRAVWVVGLAVAALVCACAAVVCCVLVARALDRMDLRAERLADCKPAHVVPAAPEGSAVVDPDTGGNPWDWGHAPRGVER